MSGGGGRMATHACVRYLQGMSRPDPQTEPQLDDAEFVEAVKAGQASLDQGCSIPYSEVRDWLLSWGTDKERPPPKCP